MFTKNFSSILGVAILAFTPLTSIPLDHIESYESTEQDWLAIEESYLWVRLTLLQQNLFERIIYGAGEEQVDAFNVLYETELQQFLDELVESFDGQFCGADLSDKKFNQLSKGFRQLQEAVKRDINRSIEMAQSLKQNKGVINYETTLAWKRWDKANAQVFYKLMKINSDFNREKLTTLLKGRMMELNYYMQNLVKYTNSSTLKDEELSIMHLKEALTYSYELSNFFSNKQLENH